MKGIQILDCTLRDGAQVNEARFGGQAVTDIIRNLRDARIEMIECGFLKDVTFEEGRTYFPQPSFARRYIPEDRGNSRYAALVDLDRYDAANLEEYDGRSFDLIRISFFEKDIESVENFARIIASKGYHISIQPMDTFSYSEEHLRQVIDLANQLRPETLSMVDTYSLATEDDVDRVCAVYREYLDEGIKIGFHSHNNKLNSLALAQRFMKKAGDGRDIVIDASLYGMGRGGGNLNTELFTEYLNRKGYKSYVMKPILDSIDKYLTKFKQSFEWGYSLPMMYAGLYGVHVHTVDYLAKKPDMTSYDLKMIFQELDPQKKKRYDYDYLDSAYEAYQQKKAKMEASKI